MSTPSEKEVRTALGRLVAVGIDSVWHPEAQVLLELPIVRERIDEPEERYAAEVLREVLVEAVAQLGQSQYRRLLTIVLGLEPKYADMSAGEKRAIAGQEFRGGTKPVGAGTIRQHHEPRALDELAALLCSEQAGSSRLAGTPPGQSALQGIEWHPAARREWAGEQLFFWRLSFGSDDPEAGLERVGTAMQEAGISSWAMFELLGGYDLLIRAWLPPNLPPSRFHDLLIDALGERLLQLDSFAVEKIVTHWPWALRDTMRMPDAKVLANRPPDREIRALNAGSDASQREAYAEQAVIASVLEGGEIGFMVVVAPRGAALAPSRQRQEVTQKAMTNLIEQVQQGPFSQLSLYHGWGFGSYLLLGRVRPESFYDLERLLVQPLDEIVRFDGSRTYTFVMSAPAALARVEEMPVNDSSPDELNVAELLRREEGQDFEVVAAAFGTAFEDSATFAPRLAKHVVGFANADGGTILVGAAEKGRRLPLDPQLAKPILDVAPEVGEYAVLGIDADAENGLDMFERRLRDSLSASIEPDPNAHVQIAFEQLGPRTVCILDVRAPERSGGAAPWFYFRAGRGKVQFMVRQGSQSRELVGPEADSYKLLKA